MLHLVGFHYKNISRCTVLWMSKVLIQIFCVLLFRFQLNSSLSLIFPSPFLTSFCWSTYFYQRNITLWYILGNTVQNKTTWIENNNCTVKFMFLVPPSIIFHLLEASLQWFPLILTGVSNKSWFPCNKSSVLGRFRCTYVHACV